MKKRNKILFAVTALFIAFIAFSAHTVSAKDIQRPIRIAYPIQAGLTEIDEEGNYFGYTFEYLEKIAQTTGWDYEYVTVPGTLDEQIVTLMDMVEKGEVDLMGGMVYSEASAEHFLYCRNKYGTSHTVLQVLKKSQYNAGNKVAAETDILRVAIMSDTGRMAEEVREYCKRCDIPLTFVVCESMSDEIRKLEEGEADALASSEMFVKSELQIVAAFAPKPFYFVSGKNADAEIMKTLDAAIINLNRNSPEYQLELYSKFFNPHADELCLSELELEYVASLPPVRVGVNRGCPPYQNYDDERGWHGICIDIIGYVSDQTGIRFEMVEIPKGEDAYTLLHEGELDILIGVPDNFALARENRVLLSDPYVTFASALVTGSQSFDLNLIEEMNIAIVSGSGSSKQVFPDNVLQYESPYECMEAVLKGEADCAYVSQLAAQYYLEESEFSKLKKVIFPNQSGGLCFAVEKPGDQALLNIINRAI